MTSQRRQADLAAELLAGWRRVDERAMALASGLGDDALCWTPPEGGWSMGQVFEHLVMGHDTYLTQLRPLVTRTDAPSAGPETIWRPSLCGRMLISALRPEQQKRKFKAPRIFQPAQQPRMHVVAEFRRSVSDLSDLIRTTAGLDWRRFRTHSPVSALIRLNLGDCHMILAVHAERHLEQIRRLRLHGEFPRAGVLA